MIMRYVSVKNVSSWHCVLNFYSKSGLQAIKSLEMLQIFFQNWNFEHTALKKARLLLTHTHVHENTCECFGRSSIDDDLSQCIFARNMFVSLK